MESRQYRIREPSQTESGNQANTESGNQASTESGNQARQKQGTKTVHNQGTKPVQNQWTKPIQNQGTKPMQNQGTKPIGNHGTTPVQNQGTKPIQNQGTTWGNQTNTESGNQAKDASWSGNRKCATISICTLHACFDCSSNINTKEVPFSASSLSSSGCSPFGLLFTNEAQRKAGSRHFWHLTHTCQPCLSCHWHRLLGTKWQHNGCVCATFRCQFLTNRMRNQEKSCFVSRLFFVQLRFNVALCPWTIRDGGSPGCPPLLSHSSWALFVFCF